MINIAKNQEINDEINRCNMRGAPHSALKSLYVERNIFDVDPDAPIFRIAQFEYLLKDIQQDQLTHTRINKVSWDDDKENPLLNKVFREASGESITLNGLVENMFGVCWSLSQMQSRDDWETFSHGKPAIRIESTPRKVLAAVMNDRNPFFMLNHAVGKIQYESQAKIDGYFDDNDYFKHLDPLGQHILLSLLKLRTSLADENEVRLLCDFSKNETWMAENMRLEKHWLRVPFNWSNVIVGMQPGPGLGSNAVFEISKAAAASSARNTGQP